MYFYHAMCLPLFMRKFNHHIPMVICNLGMQFKTQSLLFSFVPAFGMELVVLTL